MLVLALDTTNEKGGVGIFQAGECLACVPNEGPANRYSITLFQMVEEAVRQARRRLSDVELFAAANGPGSFTGIRVGLAATQAWGKAFNRPVRGISILEAMVEGVRPETPWAVPILDARRGEFYVGCFRRVEGDRHRQEGFVPEEDGWVLRPSSLEIFLADRFPDKAAVTCIVRDHDGAAFALREKLPPAFEWRKIDGTLVAPIARLALAAQQKGLRSTPAELNACYIRRPDAEVNWKG
jgi:tRNA threonylcarbamoyladenosine biosynthesis protein TsaB